MPVLPPFEAAVVLVGEVVEEAPELVTVTVTGTPSGAVEVEIAVV